MRIETTNNLYFFGSVLTDDRCNDFVKLFDYAESTYKNKKFSYRELQQSAQRDNVFSASTIRTFITIYKGLGFVSYDDSASFCFSVDGCRFVSIHKALNASLLLPFSNNRTKILGYLKNAEGAIFWKGLINLCKTDSDNGKKLNLALDLLAYFKEINWNEYLYAVSCMLDRNDYDSQSIIHLVEADRNNNMSRELFQWSKQNRQYEDASPASSYIKSLLKYTNLIEDGNQNCSRITPLFDTFNSLRTE